MKDAMTDHKAEWVLVPRVATEAMLREGYYASTAGVDFLEAFQIRWAAMIAAAPAASEGEDGAVAWVVTGGGPASVLHRYYGSAQTDLRNRNSGAAIWPLYLRPAAQVAATPKHDEGREADALADRLQRMARNIEANNMTRDRPSGFGRELVDLFDIAATTIRALATQPAARRVTEQDVERACIAALPWFADISPSGKEAVRRETRIILESFAQPAEGVSGG